jgi:AraC-like DNA-binding protein
MLKKLIQKIREKTWSSAVEVKWLGFVMKFFIAVLVLMIGTTAYDMASIYSGKGKPWASETFFILFAAVLVCSISYKGLINPAIFFGDDDEGDNSVKYNLSEQRIREIMTKVRKVMESEKPYLDPKLTLPALSLLTEVPRGDLSSAINSDTGQNFYDFINTFRITHVKTLLEKSNPDVKIIEIAFCAGFSSKSTFNDAFKRITGLTPSEYRKSILG